MLSEVCCAVIQLRLIFNVNFHDVRNASLKIRCNSSKHISFLVPKSPLQAQLHKRTIKFCQLHSACTAFVALLETIMCANLMTLPHLSCPRFHQTTASALVWNPEFVARLSVTRSSHCLMLAHHVNTVRHYKQRTSRCGLTCKTSATLSSDNSNTSSADLQVTVRRCAAAKLPQGLYRLVFACCNLLFATRI